MRPCLPCTPTASTQARYGVPRSHYSLRPDARDSFPTSFAGFAQRTAHPRAGAHYFDRPTQNMRYESFLESVE
jgi:hypothetical protein